MIALASCFKSNFFLETSVLQGKIQQSHNLSSTKQQSKHFSNFRRPSRELQQMDLCALTSKPGRIASFGVRCSLPFYAAHSLWSSMYLSGIKKKLMKRPLHSLSTISAWTSSEPGLQIHVQFTMTSHTPQLVHVSRIPAPREDIWFY